MKRARFLVSSLLAAGFTGHQDALAASLTSATSSGGDGDGRANLLQRFAQDHYVTLAQHRSHSSHSSHSSHRSGYSGGHYSHTSHRSSTGGGYDYSPPYVAPAPAPSPTPSPTPRYVPQPFFSPQTRASAPPSDGLPALSGRTARFTAIVRRVQLALFAQDLYKGSIDGVVGPGLRAALRAFQRERGLDVTGTITTATLDALQVSSE